MLKSSKVYRKGDFTKIPNYIRRRVVRASCAICLQPYNRVYTIGHGVRYPKQVLDHLIPRRFLNEHGIYEHHVTNLLSVCQYCHGPKAKLEDRLYEGNLLSFLQGLSRLGYPVKRIVRFAESVGLREFRGVNV